MNSCFYLANEMSYAEAEAVITDPDSPECLVTAANWLLAQATRYQEEDDDPRDPD